MRAVRITRNGHPFRGARCVTRNAMRRPSVAGRYNSHARNATGIHCHVESSAIREEGRKISGKNFDRYFISKRPDNAPRGVDNPRIFADATEEVQNIPTRNALRKRPRDNTFALPIVFSDPRYIEPRLITGVRIRRRKEAQ